MSNPYTVPTGDGYLGVWQATGYHVEISIGTFTGISWSRGDPVYVVDGEIGLEVIRHPGGHPEGYLAEAPVHHSNTGTSVGIPAKALRQLQGLEKGADVRAYERDEGGMTLVPAEGDPFVDEPNGAEKEAAHGE